MNAAFFDPVVAAHEKNLGVPLGGVYQICAREGVVQEIVLVQGVEVLSEGQGLGEAERVMRVRGGLQVKAVPPIGVLQPPGPTECTHQPYTCPGTTGPR